MIVENLGMQSMVKEMVKWSLHFMGRWEHATNSTLPDDAWRAFSSYANTKGLAHYSFKSDGKQRVKGVFHIQNVNSYHSRLKKWMDRFNGVATKYLQHYLAWFRYLDSKEYENTASNKKHMLVNSCLFTVTVTNAELRRKAFSY